jgi:hypothetical protein
MTLHAMEDLQTHLRGVRLMLIDSMSVMGLLHWAGICDHTVTHAACWPPLSNSLTVPSATATSHCSVTPPAAHRPATGGAHLHGLPPHGRGTTPQPDGCWSSAFHARNTQR